MILAELLPRGMTTVEVGGLLLLAAAIVGVALWARLEPPDDPDDDEPTLNTRGRD